MFQRFSNNNQLIGLTIMLLMVLALVASQADASIDDQVKAAVFAEQSVNQASSRAPLTATIKGHINGKVLTISIDTLSHFGLFRLERETI
ncbi:MAG: hypothetical protein WBN07_06515 [Woeseiaceae bacterium]